MVTCIATGQPVNGNYSQRLIYVHIIDGKVKTWKIRRGGGGADSITSAQIGWQKGQENLSPPHPKFPL